MKAEPGAVYLVGAGPGDPGLITVRGRALLETADVVVHDRLIGWEILTLARPGAELIDVGKKPGDHTISQQQIEQTLVDRAARGLRVVRLKGGDPFVFGRGFEELRACREAGVPCVVVPGITSAIAGPAAAGIPITLRGVSRSFAVVTAGVAPGAPDVDFSAFNGVDTLVVLMGRSRLAEVAAALVRAGRSPTAPTACIERATTARQRVVRGTLESIAGAAEEAALCSPMVAVIGDVAACADAASESGALAGKRILITRSESPDSSLMRGLVTAGARPVLAPMIQNQYQHPHDAEERLNELPAYQWLLFTSIHGVHGFWRILTTSGHDARALAACKVAAIGPATAAGLAQYGLGADLVPDEHTGASLAKALLANGAAEGTKVLYPRGNLGGDDIREGLRRGGVQVDELLVYATVDATPSQASMAQIEEGVDAILFFSPSGVRRFSSLGLRTGNAAVACIGPTTAATAAELGMHVDIVAPSRTAEALLEAVAEFFQLASVAS